MYKIIDNKHTKLVIDYEHIADKYIIVTELIYNNNKINAKSLVDTGANCSCISKRIANYLNLMPIDVVTINTPSGSAIVNVYAIDIVINNEVQIMDVRVCDSDIGNQGIDLLLGTDIISLGNLNITNNDKTIFSFEIPAK